MDAILLAGGLGTRLRSVVSEVAKCMAPVAGEPFLAYLLRYLSRYPQVDRVLLSVGYLRESIISWVEAHRADYPFTFDFVIEETPLGTGGGIRLALDHARSEQVWVLNGDTFFDVDLTQMAAATPCDAAITLALCPMRNFSRYGTVALAADGRITEFREKIQCADGLINGGVTLINRRLLDLTQLPEKFSFETEVLVPAAAAGRLYGVVQNGYFIDIGIPEDYHRAEFELPYDTLLLDRDGVINVWRPGDYVKRWFEFEFIPAFMERIAVWSKCFKHIFVVTNQRGVGRGKMTQADLDDIHQRMVAAIEAVGGRIDGIYCCTAVNDSDPRRKPNRGMFDEILRDHPDVNPATTLMLGDSAGDMAFARNAGVMGHLVSFPHEASSDPK
jgi:D-glycero-alpha-D-manno-heptose 1-phosphate guanylyltransferase